MLDLFGPLIFGLIGSVHCLGMCGPLIVAYSLHLRPADGYAPSSLWSQSSFHHAAFHAGRLCTYGLLGGLAGGIGSLAALPQVFAGLRSVVSLGGGIFMLLLGLVLLGVFPARFISLPAWGSSNVLTRRYASRLFTSHSHAARFVLGFAAGFLPCMLSFTMIVKAATTAGVLSGFFTMLCFGLGTLPALFAVGFSASALSIKTRIAGERLAGVTVIIMGLMLIWKGGRYLIA